MTTFKAIVLDRYLRRDKTFPIKIRLTHKRKKRFINTGLVATSDDLTFDIVNYLPTPKTMGFTLLYVKNLQKIASNTNFMPN